MNREFNIKIEENELANAYSLVISSLNMPYNLKNGYIACTSNYQGLQNSVVFADIDYLTYPGYWKKMSEKDPKNCLE